MAANLTNSELEKYIADEVRLYAKTRVPVKASMLERMLVRNISSIKLHPNPEDEFCDPHIGPNHQIISSYVKMIKECKKHGDIPWDDDPIEVEKTFPDGYLILNGHHRWAACRIFGYNKTRVHIVNLTQQQDIEKMLRRSDNHKRATLDFDEVVLCPEGSDHYEKKLRLPGGLFYKEKLKLGIPALFRFLAENGYDVWVYSYKYYSFDYIRHLFRKYHSGVTGVVTGAGRKSAAYKEKREHTEKLFAGKYSETLHISVDSVVRIRSGQNDHEMFEINDTEAGWYRAVMDIVKDLSDNAE